MQMLGKEEGSHEWLIVYLENGYMSNIVIVGMDGDRGAVAPAIGEALMDSHQGRWRQPETPLPDWTPTT